MVQLKWPVQLFKLTTANYTETVKNRRIAFRDFIESWISSQDYYKSSITICGQTHLKILDLIAFKHNSTFIELKSFPEI